MRGAWLRRICLILLHIGSMGLKSGEYGGRYRRLAPTFWVLAVLCASLRYLMDAHWPSDILGGVALGYGVAYVAVKMTRFAH